MTDNLLAALRPVLEHVSVYLQTKPELRREVAAAARALADWVDPSLAEASPAGAPTPVTSPPPLIALQPIVEPVVRETASLDGLILPIPLIPKSSVVMPATATPSQPPGEHGRDFIPLPLTTIAARCRVKGAAAKLIGRRVGGASVGETLVEEAGLRKQAEAIPDCGLWMLDPDGYARSKPVWEDLAGGFAVCAAAADLLRGWTAAGSDLSTGQEVLTLAAEAQSMLLYAVADVGWVTRDHEQVQMFVHIRELGKHHQIYVPRFLRREDPADPSRWPDLAERLKAAVARFGGASVPGLQTDQAKLRQKTLSNLKFKLRKLAEEPNGIADEWPRVVELLDQAVAAGVPPSSLELRDLLLPVYDHLPETLTTSPGAERVFRAIELYRDSLREATEQVPPDEPPTAEVARVCEWLRGKELVLIGGLRRPHHVAALKRAFGLDDVRWLTTPDHTSFTVFEPDIARPEVAVVVLAIRWANHDYAEVLRYCDKYGKPLVRLRAGYHANQIARHVIDQAGERMATASGEGFSAGL